MAEPVFGLSLSLLALSFDFFRAIDSVHYTIPHHVLYRIELHKQMISKAKRL